MIQVPRVLAPLALHGRTTSPYRDNRYRKKLNNIDIKKFKKSLSHAVGLTDYYHLKEKASEYFNELEILKPENKSLNEKIELLLGKQSAYEEMEKRYDILLEIMIDWHRGLSGGGLMLLEHILRKKLQNMMIY